MMTGDKEGTYNHFFIVQIPDLFTDTAIRVKFRYLNGDF